MKDVLAFVGLSDWKDKRGKGRFSTSCSPSGGLLLNAVDKTSNPGRYMECVLREFCEGVGLNYPGQGVTINSTLKRLTNASGGMKN